MSNRLPQGHLPQYRPDAKTTSRRRLTIGHYAIIGVIAGVFSGIVGGPRAVDSALQAYTTRYQSPAFVQTVADFYHHDIIPMDQRIEADLQRTNTVQWYGDQFLWRTVTAGAPSGVAGGLVGAVLGGIASLRRRENK